MSTPPNNVSFSALAVQERVQADLPSARLVHQAVSALVIENQQNYELACDLLKLVKREYNTLDEARRAITGPLRNAERSTNGFFQPLLNHYEQCEAHLKAQIGTWDRKVQAEREAAMRIAAPAPPPPEPSKGVSTRTVRRWRITDPDKVPRQFCSPDPSKIQEHISAGGLEAIPGVEFYSDTIVSVRT